MKITEELLKELGAVKKDLTWHLKINGYEFELWQYVGEEWWRFNFASLELSSKLDFINTLQDLIFCVANNCIMEGKLLMKRSIKDLLGV